MSDTKIYSLEELRKMSSADRSKLMVASDKELAQLNLNIRTGKEKQSHLVKQWAKQRSQIQTLNNQPN
ncbi:MAG: 50S ribosomal protein L29 [Candidatus Gracilibacteria bacterium]|jgi:ribosomal protein L29